jgi:hypothetical protein
MTRRAYALGLAANVAVVLGASVGAYTGTLGRIGAMPWEWISAHDYFFHGLLIGPLAFFLDGALSFRPLSTRLGAFPPLAAVVVLAIAGTEEIAQQLSPRRSTSLHDFVGDAVGVIVFATLSRLLRQRATRASGQSPA